VEEEEGRGEEGKRHGGGANGGAKCQWGHDGGSLIYRRKQLDFSIFHGLLFLRFQRLSGRLTSMLFPV